MAENIVIVTVHGTRTRKFENPKTTWRQRTAKFIAKLFRRARPNGTDASATPSTKLDASDPGWWLPTSEFAKKLLQRLKPHGVNPRIQAFEWSGANSGSE